MSKYPTKKMLIKANVDVIDRTSVPKSFYLPKYSATKDWKQIFKFTFSNNFEYYMGSNKSFIEGSDLMTILSIEYGIVKTTNNPYQFKKKLQSEYASTISIKNAFRVFNWYKQKLNIVRKIINQFMDV